MTQKRCSRCKEIKDVSEFYRRDGTPGRYTSHCKSCQAKYRQTAGYKALHRKADEKWRRTEKGRLYNRAQCKKYNQTEGYKKSINKWRAAHPERRAAHIKFAHAIAGNKIKRPSVCSACKVQCTPEGHHPDYSKPLDVIWLCRQCHVDLHRALAHSLK